MISGGMVHRIIGGGAPERSGERGALSAVAAAFRTGEAARTPFGRAAFFTGGF
jgi:hypothetical protein